MDTNYYSQPIERSQESGVTRETALDAERLLLGSILWEPETLPITRLKPEDFSYEKHRIIFAAMIELVKSGVELDLYNLYEHLERDGNLSTVGGSLYLTGLTELVLTERVKRDELESAVLWESWKIGREAKI